MKVIDIDPRKELDKLKLIEMMSALISKKTNIDYQTAYKMLNSSVERSLDSTFKGLAEGRIEEISKLKDSKLKDLSLEDILDKAIKD